MVNYSLKIFIDRFRQKYVYFTFAEQQLIIGLWKNTYKSTVRESYNSYNESKS